METELLRALRMVVDVVDEGNSMNESHRNVGEEVEEEDKKEEEEEETTKMVHHTVPTDQR